MDEPYQEKHGAFILKCSPVMDSQGGYRPNLVATRVDRLGVEHLAVALPVSPSFSIPSAAAEFALTFGKRWVRDRMLPPPVDMQ